jgi:hypothetical protein
VGPHSVTLSSGAQELPQAWKPASQTTPHAPATHVAAPPGGAMHGVHDVPHEAGESLLRQVPPHA